MEDSIREQQGVDQLSETLGFPISGLRRSVG